MNKRYYRKYHLLKRRIKDIIFENAALCDQVAQVQENVAKALEEKRFLTKRLVAHDPESALPVSITEKRIPVRKKSQDRQSTTTSTNHKPALKIESQSPPKNNSRTTLPANCDAQREPYTKAKVKIEQQELKEEPEEDDPPDIAFLDPSMSTVGQSYAIDNLIIQSLGEIQVERPSFHTDRWIYPVGFKTNRIYGSMANPFIKSVYTCAITEVAGNPRFEMSSEADPEVMIVGPSPQFCHTTLLRYLQDTHGLDQLATVEPDGNWFFGLGHPLVMSLMQGMANFGACLKFQGFTKVTNEAAIQEKENDPGINYEAFLQLVGQLASPEEGMYQEEIKEELIEG